MTVSNAAAGRTASSSFPALFLAALLGLGPVDPSLIPLPRAGRASPDIDPIYPETGSDSQVRRTASNRNGLNSALDSDGIPFPHHPNLSRKDGLQPNLEGAGVPNVSGRGPPTPSLFPPARDGTPSGRQQHKRRRRRRRKRNQTVDTSDPLCLHTGQRGRCSYSQKEERAQEETQAPPETEQSHNVSKETITSTSDDPFKVVQPPGGAASPRSVGSDKALTKKRTAAEEEEEGLAAESDIPGNRTLSAVQLAVESDLPGNRTLSAIQLADPTANYPKQRGAGSV